MLHFLNCVLLTFAPFALVYRATKLSEESALYSCIMAGVGYAATQVLKIFVMATFLPSFVFDGLHFSVAQELLKSVTQLIDWAGVYYTLQYVPRLSKFETSARILCVGVGWAGAEAVASYLVPLWIGARGMEFSWQYVEMGVAANINLWLHTAFIGLVWLRARTNVDRAVQPLLLSGCAAYILLPSVLAYLQLVVGVGAWGLLFVRAAVTAALGVACNAFLERYKSGAADAVASPRATAKSD